MDKAKLERVITKYNLSGACEDVAWKVDKNKLSIRGISQNKHVLSEVDVDNIDLPDGEFGIKETKMVKSLLGVLGATPTATVVSTNGITTGIQFADSDTKVVYALADVATAISPVPEYKLPVMDISVILDDKFINTYVKAKGAMGTQAETVTFVSDGKTKTASVILNHSAKNVNKVSMAVNITDAAVLPPTSFSADYLKEVLVANKEVTDGTLEVSSKGIAVLRYSIDGIKCAYVMRKVV